MRSTDGASVRVVIPSWNGWDLLSEVCLPGIARQDFADYEAVVVDNGSTDGTVSKLANRWPTVKVISLPKNLGFAAAVNAGVQEATATYVAVVNNDVELYRTWLSNLVAAMETRPSAASATGKMLRRTDRSRISSAGDKLSWDGIASPRGSGEIDVGQYDDAEPVLCGTAGASVYRRAALGVIGGFDEDFFAYLEDVDWGLRAQLLDFECWYIPSAVSVHVGSATSGRIPGFRVYSMIRNTPWLVLKDFPMSRIIRGSPRILAALAIRSYRGAKAGHGRVVVRAWSDSVRRLPLMLSKRRQIQGSRRRNLQERDILFEERNLGSEKLARFARFRRRGVVVTK